MSSDPPKLEAPLPPSEDNDDAMSVASVSSVASGRSVTSVTSAASSVSRLPKLATRIARPCQGHQKPAVPASPQPKANSTNTSVRNMSDDSIRHRVTAGSTASSIDALWETHPRRLSEAGLSRHSDSSVILTEDTDSFIIGERVWVSGTKPGHIAYIGETQFAPGDWAGIALDEPIGKNDGSVGGIRYFQCEPKKGVFSRLTRLTRYPINQEGMGSGDTRISSPASPVGGAMRRSPGSPTSSTSLMRTMASIGDSNTSLASNTSHHIDYKVGDRVIIKSSQGSKVGTVRFIGTTEFASGEWVGVELDDPRGKNDGSVNGVRYFECRPNFGLFAPISKVCKSPLKSRPGNCQIHNSSGALPPSGILRRTGSKESMSNASITSASAVSQQGRRVRLGVAALMTHHDTAKGSPLKSSTTTSTPTRTALQDLLKEKQQHIEQLLKERDLERSEIAKAASQAEDAKQKFVTVKLEFEKYRTESETKLQECLDVIEKLKQNKSELQNQLEDERRKNEDLLFRLEETSITKDEIDALNNTHLTKIKELEEELERAKEKAYLAESETNKKSEIEEALLKAKEEIITLTRQLDESKMQTTVLEGDHATTTILIESLQKEVDQYKLDLLERNNMIAVLQQEISKTTAELSKQRNDLETICEAKNNEKIVMQKELEYVNQLLKEKMSALEKVTTEKLDSETALERQIEKLKIELSAKSFDLETAGNSIQMKDREIDQLKSEIDDLNGVKIQLEQVTNILKGKEDDLVKLQSELKSSKENLDKTLNDLKAYQDNLSSVESKLKKENDELLSKLKLQNNQFDETQKELFEKLANTETRLSELTKDNVDKEEELKRVKSELINIVTENDKSLREVTEKYTLELENITTKLKQLQVELEEKNCKLIELEKMKDNTLKEITQKSEIEEQLSSTVRHLEERNKQLSNENADFVKKVEESNNKINELNTQIEDSKQQLHTLKEKLEAAIQDGDHYKTAFKEKAKEVDTLRFELQSMEATLEAAKNDLAVYQANLSDVEVTLRKEKEELRACLQSERVEFEKSRKDLQQKLEEAEKMILEKTEEVTDKNQKLEQLAEKLREIGEHNEKILNEVKQKYQKDMEDSQTKISNLLAEIESKNIKITDIEICIEEARSNATKKIEENEMLKTAWENAIRQHEVDSQNISKLNEEVITLKCVNEEMKKQIEESLVRYAALDSEKENLDESLKSKIEDLVTTTQRIEFLDREVTEKDNNIVKINEELESTKQRLETVENELNVYRSRLNDMEGIKKEKEAIITNLERKTTELEAEKNKIVEKLAASEVKLSQVKKLSDDKAEEINELNKRISSLIEDTDKNITDILESHKKEHNDMAIRVSDLLTELENRNSNITELEAYKTEAEFKIMKQDAEIKALQTELDAMKSQTAYGNENNMKLSENLREVSLKHVDTVQKLQESTKKTESLEIELRKAKEEKKLLEADVAKFKETAKLLSEDNQSIVGRLNETQKELQELKDEKERLNSEIKNIASASGDTQKLMGELHKQLDEKTISANTAKVDYEQKLQTLEKTIQELSHVNKELEKQKTDLEIKLMPLIESETQLKQIIASSTVDTTIEKLRKELKEANQKLLEKEKQMNEEIDLLKLEVKKSHEQGRNGSVQGDTNAESNMAQTNDMKPYNQLLEEKIFAENQVKFLNSIIVDMHEKNEEQKARIEILEMGYSSSAADELAANMNYSLSQYANMYYFYGVAKGVININGDLGFKAGYNKQLAPRIYCDICEEFDLHETEDCPTQADEPIVNRNVADKPKEKPAPRPYCDNCEVFGHCTEECTEEPQEF